MNNQMDLLDSAPLVVGMGGQRVGHSLKRLVESGIVEIGPAEEGQARFKITVTEGGRKFLAGMRALRLSI